MTWTRRREFFLVVVAESRREYVCVSHEEPGDWTWYNSELASRGYELDLGVDAAQGDEMQVVMCKHGYRRILAFRQITGHDLIRCRSLPNPRSMTLTMAP